MFSGGDIAWSRSSKPKDFRRRKSAVGYNRAAIFGRTPEIKADVKIPRWTIWVGISAVVAIFILWLLTAAPWLKVKDIRIEGVATEETKAEIEKLKGQNILWLSVTSPDRVVTEHQPSIKEIKILRGIPDTLIVKLIEREPSMIWQVNDVWYTVDPTGFVFKEQQINKREDGSLDYPGTTLPVVVDTKLVPVRVKQTIVRPQFITFVKTLQERLPKELNLRVIRGEVGETTFNVTMVTDAGWNVLFDTTRPLEAQMKTLMNVLESKRADIHQYVDVRVRGWVYYK